MADSGPTPDPGVPDAPTVGAGAADRRGDRTRPGGGPGGGHGFQTRAIHAGQDPEPRTGSVAVPVFQTSTYVQDGVGQHRGYEYARTANPTRDALQECLASLEGAEAGVAFASGLSAEDAVLRLLDPGDRVLVANDVYGGTWRLMDKVHARYDVAPVACDLQDLEATRQALTEAGGTIKFVWAETPSNPLLKILDLEALADLAHEFDARLVADNTFATPYLQQPLALGADIVVHSTTKYIGGHSDVVGGAVCCDEQIGAELRYLQNAVGAVPGPWDAWLTLRGAKTLGVRMDRHCDNAERIAEYLSTHDAVSHVLYPGLTDHPGHAVAQHQMLRFGGMISFRLAAGREHADRVAAGTELFFLAESLGGVESLIEHPGVMTHASVAGTELEVPDDLLRISVGIEDVDDLLADLDHALSG